MLDEFAEEMAMRLMDNWSSRITTDMIGFLIEGRVRAITFAPHTIQNLQMFDGTFFGVLKRHTRYELPFGDEKTTVKFRMKGYHAFKQAMVTSNIWGAFQPLGFEYEFDTTSEPDRLLFNEEKPG
jgi:hypothetical protein